jgi:signal transduction histidine kinase
VREKKDRIALGKFLKDNIVSYFASVRFEKRHIGVDVRIRRDFSVLMNMGKLTQIIDNLFLNSEYWLQEDLRRKHIKRGLITVEISRPFLRVHDNGRGIDPSVESGLFEPFVTRKPPGVGRGLGLFIVRQLLDSDGCTITALPNRNQYGHLHAFEINFTGALKENGRPS